MKVSEVIKNKFIFISLFCFILYFGLSAEYPPVPEGSKIYSSFLNLINALGALFLVTGFYDVTLKEKFQDETINKFVNTLLLKNEYLDNFKDTEIKGMFQKLQLKLLKNNNNTIYKNKLISLINNKLLKMANGELEEDELKTFFKNYDEELIYEKSKDKKTIICNLFVNYTLVNLSKEPILQPIFTKKMFPTNINQYQGNPLELLELKIIVDGKELSQYKDKKKIDEHFGLNKNITESISITNQEQIPMQIQEKIKDTSGNISLKEFKINFNTEIVIKKKLKLIVMYDDIIYGHTFHRPMLNYNFRFRDENAKKVSAILRSAFHKKSDDTIVVKNTSHNELSISLKEDLLLPKEGLSVVSIR